MSENSVSVNNFIEVYCKFGAYITLKIGKDIQILKINNIISYSDGDSVIIEGDNDYKYIVTDIHERTVQELDDYLLIHNDDIDIYIEDFV